jgi:uracil-DNA glycosylase family 4
MSGQDTKQQKLEQIKADILRQNICPDLAKSAKNLVMGDGNADADIVFIGEAPGKNEDEQGLPFVGAAGKFLNEMLGEIGLKRSDIYITNIVKYRPPSNRDPLPDEKTAFLPFLKQQIDIIEPKLIVTLGRHSMETLLPGLKISECHGQPKRIRVRRAGGPGVDAMQGADEKRTEPYLNTVKGVSQSATQQSAAKGGGIAGSAGDPGDLAWVILPLFHPAAALYNGAMRQTLIDDFAKVPKVLEMIDK